MRYRSLGDSGLLVSVVGLGGNNFGRRLDMPRTRAVVDAAMDAGITLIDTSDTYGNGGGPEEILGEVLAGHRDQVVLATKFGHQRLDMGYGLAAGATGSRAYIRRAVEASLRRLRTDYLDLYQLHTPDPVTPGRGNPARARRTGQCGQGPLSRPLHPDRLADGRRRPRSPAGRHRAVHLRAEPLVAAGAAGRGGARARGPPVRARRAALLPAGPTACSRARSAAARHRRPAAGWPAGRGGPGRTGQDRSPAGARVLIQPCPGWLSCRSRPSRTVPGRPGRNGGGPAGE
jgi:Aldo/keto reductase family